MIEHRTAVIDVLQLCHLSVSQLRLLAAAATCWWRHDELMTSRRRPSSSVDISPLVTWSELGLRVRSGRRVLLVVGRTRRCITSVGSSRTLVPAASRRSLLAVLSDHWALSVYLSVCHAAAVLMTLSTDRQSSSVCTGRSHVWRHRASQRHRKIICAIFWTKYSFTRLMRCHFQTECGEVHSHTAHNSKHRHVNIMMQTTHFETFKTALENSSCTYRSSVYTKQLSQRSVAEIDRLYWIHEATIAVTSHRDDRLV